MINHEQSLEQLLKYRHILNERNAIRLENKIIILIYVLVTNKVQMQELNIIKHVVHDDVYIQLIDSYDQTNKNDKSEYFLLLISFYLQIISILDDYDLEYILKLVSN
jgi:hypothetical protein